jgi:hypothetical protein
VIPIFQALKIHSIRNHTCTTLMPICLTCHMQRRRVAQAVEKVGGNGLQSSFLVRNKYSRSILSDRCVTRSVSSRLRIVLVYVSVTICRRTREVTHITQNILLLLADDRPCPELKLVIIGYCLNTQSGRSATSIKDFVSPSLGALQVSSI